MHVVQTYHRTHTFTGGKAPFENKMYVRIQDWVGGFLKKEYAIQLTFPGAFRWLPRGGPGPFC